MTFDEEGWSQTCRLIVDSTPEAGILLASTLPVTVIAGAPVQPHGSPSICGNAQCKTVARSHGPISVRETRRIRDTKTNHPFRLRAAEARGLAHFPHTRPTNLGRIQANVLATTATVLTLFPDNELQVVCTALRPIHGERLNTQADGCGAWARGSLALYRLSKQNFESCPCKGSRLGVSSLTRGDHGARYPRITETIV